MNQYLLYYKKTMCTHNLQEHRMPEQSYWGANGEYGPFSKLEDGWPHAGEVIRCYRRQLGMSAEKLATLYGERIGTPVTARWILKMEQQGKVPTDITKRR